MRTIRLRSLVQARHDYVTGKAAPLRIFDNLIAAALPPIDKRVLDYVRTCQSVTSADLVQHLDMQLTHASTVLLNLYSAGLLTRTKIVDEQGKHYLYRRN